LRITHLRSLVSTFFQLLFASPSLPLGLSAKENNKTKKNFAIPIEKRFRKRDENNKKQSNVTNNNTTKRKKDQNRSKIGITSLQKMKYCTLVVALFLILGSVCDLTPSAAAEASPVRSITLGASDRVQCDLCNFLVKMVDEAILANATEQVVKEMLMDGCSLFSPFPSFKAECIALVNNYFAALMFILEEEVDDNRVCDGLSFCIVNPLKPRFIHLSLHPTPTAITISWFTYNATSNPLAKIYSAPNGPLVTTVKAQSNTYYQPGGYSYHAVVTGLKASTTYWYVVGDSQGGWSSPLSFNTAPATSQPFTIAVYGDMGVHNSQNTTPHIITLAKNKSLDWVYHIGDIGYGDDYPANIYEYVWNEWFKRVEPASSIIPYMTCPGNHEYSCEHPGCILYSAGFAAYNHRFRMPGIESGSNTSMYFSFDYSYAHFISISTETDYPNPPFPTKFGNQLAWLENDLRIANNKRTAQRPWIIVVGHRPIYASNAQQNSVPSGYAKFLQRSFEDLFYKWGVDLYIAGHEHYYERIYPTYANKVVSTSYNNPTATTYLVSGAAGCIEGLEAFNPGPVPAWSAKRYSADEGFGLLNVGPTTLNWQFIGASDGTVRDEFTLTKKSAN
jgi:hypothetical protein